MQFIDCEDISNTKQITRIRNEREQSLLGYGTISPILFTNQFFQKNNDINQELISVQHQDQLY